MRRLGLEAGKEELAIQKTIQTNAPQIEKQNRGIWASIFGPRTLLRWDVLGTIIPGIFIAVGLGMLSLDWFPHNLLIGQFSFVVAGVLFITKTIGYAIEHTDHRAQRTLFAAIICIVICMIEVPFLWIIQKHKPTIISTPQTAPNPTTTATRTMSLIDVWKENTPGTMRRELSTPKSPAFTYTKVSTNEKLEVQMAVISDVNTRTFVFSLYIPASPLTSEFCANLAKKDGKIIKSLMKYAARTGSSEEAETPPPYGFVPASPGTFAHKIYIYHETGINMYERAKIIHSLESQGIAVEFRGYDYLLTRLAGAVEGK